MAGLVSKICRSLISPLPTIYSSSLKRLVKSMLRKNPEHRPSGVELLRNPCLESCIANSSNPSPSLLPIKIAPKGATDKAGKNQHASQSRRQSAHRQRDSGTDATNYAEITGHSIKWEPMVRPNCVTNENRGLESILDASNAEIKRVDQISSKKLIAEVEQKDWHMKSQPIINMEKQNGDFKLVKQMKIRHAQPPSAHISTEHKDEKKSVLDMDVADSKANMCHTSAQYDQTIGNVEAAGRKGETTAQPHQVEAVFDEKSGTPEKTLSDSPVTHQQGDTGVLEWDGVTVVQQRVDALESLLEICAKLLQHEKLDELAGILKPVGEETVSSRETEIWLTKSPMSVPKSGGGS